MEQDKLKKDKRTYGVRVIKNTTSKVKEIKSTVKIVRKG